MVEQIKKLFCAYSLRNMEKMSFFSEMTKSF